MPMRQPLINKRQTRFSKNQIFIKSDVMNHIFNKEKFISKIILENFPDETVSYDENDKIIIAKLDDARFVEKGIYVYGEKSEILDIFNIGLNHKILIEVCV